MADEAHTGERGLYLQASRHCRTKPARASRLQARPASPGYPLGEPLEVPQAPVPESRAGVTVPCRSLHPHPTFPFCRGGGDLYRTCSVFVWVKGAYTDQAPSLVPCIRMTDMVLLCLDGVAYSFQA